MIVASGFQPDSARVRLEGGPHGQLYSDRHQWLASGGEHSGLPQLEHSLLGRSLEEMDDARDAAGPARLVARAETGAIVAMEKLGAKSTNPSAPTNPLHK